MSNENTSFAFKGGFKDVLEDGFSDVGIESGEGVVEDCDVGVAVESTTDIKTLLLTAR